MPRFIIAALAALAVVAVPAVADASTLHINGSKQRILLQADPGEVNLVDVEGSRSIVIRDLNAPIKLARKTPCRRIDERAVRCSRIVRVIELDLGDAPDVAVIDTSREVELDGGPGNDRYAAHTTTSPSRVRFAGGLGLDVANYRFTTEAVNVTVGGASRDGRPGDDDRILGDVESVFGSLFDDVIVGSDRTTQLQGLDGDDVITGGTAEELLSGGDGNDRIDARDDMIDSVDCGGWLLDWAAVDVHDTVTGCAQVVR